MTLPPGTRLAGYEIISAVGAGGMGEVYRARDTRLQRDAAIKVLPQVFAADADRLARFEREAQTLAALNHPNIAQVFGVITPPEAQLSALAMEFVDGEDLAQRLARGPMPLDEATAVAIQIVAGLEAAHEQGIVHRDLKPANVRVRPDATVKILDFGLAKGPVRPAAGASGSPWSGSGATLTSPAMTGAGVILGTAAYMAPEQAKGGHVDKRADIWAFGCLLYEMLAGRRPFPGDNTTEVLATVVLKEPDWSALPANVPTRLRELLRRCLEKDPRRRLRDIGDAAYDLSAADAVSPSPARRGRLSWALAAGMFVAGAGLAALVTLALQAPAPQPSTRRFAIAGLSPLLFDAYQSLTLAPDGSALAFRGRGNDGVERIYLRRLHSLDLHPVAGSEGGRLPFFSTDGAWIGFFASGALKRIAVGGGPPQTLAEAQNPAGGTWMDDGTIVFGDTSRLLRVPANGGPAETILDSSQGTRNAFASPWGLPGSRGVLLMVRDGARYDVGVLSFATREVRVLVQDGYSPAWSPGGRVLFHQANAILAIPFDLATLSAGRGAAPVAEGIGTRISYQSRLFALAADDTLVYSPGATPGEGGWALVQTDRTGREATLAKLDRQADTPRFSPDGKRVAFRAPAPNCDIWVRDLVRGTSARITREGDNHGVVWDGSGARLFTARAGSGGSDLIALPADGSGPPEVVAKLHDLASAIPTSASAATIIVQERFTPRTGTDVIAVQRAGGEWRSVLDGASDEGSGTVSPDGKLLAYVSDESGRNEIYLRPYPGDGPRTIISIDGGIEPVWSPAGGELFFRNGRDVLAVEIKGETAGIPRVLFAGDYPFGPQVANYDVSPDGRHFLMMRGRQWAEGQLIVVMNGFGPSQEQPTSR